MSFVCPKPSNGSCLRQNKSQVLSISPHHFSKFNPRIPNFTHSPPDISASLLFLFFKYCISHLIVFAWIVPLFASTSPAISIDQMSLASSNIYLRFPLRSVLITRLKLCPAPTNHTHTTHTPSSLRNT